MKSGSGSGWIDVALPLSSCKRQTNPGAASAIALIGSRLATNSAVSGASIGWCRRATLSCARCHWVMRRERLRPRDRSRASSHRQDEYLEYAAAALDVASPLNVIVHLERARSRPSFGFDPARRGTGLLRGRSFRAIDNFVDTTDFDVLYLMNLWYGYRDDAPPATQDAIEQRLLVVQVLVHRADAGRARRPQVLLVREPPHHLPRRRVPRRPGVPGRDVQNDGSTGAEHARVGRRADPRLARREGALRVHRVALRRLLPEGRHAAAHARRVRADADLAGARGDGARPRVLRHRAPPAARQPAARRTAART